MGDRRGQDTLAAEVADLRDTREAGWPGVR